jgi:hypothetical protein
MPTARVQLREVKTISKSVPCMCGKGTMVGTGSVKLFDNTYLHEHKCLECGAIEWFKEKYPLREEREVLIAQE